MTALLFQVPAFDEEMARRGRELEFNDEEIEDLVDMRINDRLTFALLSLLFPFIDLRYQFHIDHIFPSARFSNRRLREACIAEEGLSCFRERKDGLANLQLLEGAMNMEKNAAMPAAWLSKIHPNETSRRAYEERHLLGDVPESITEFTTFYDARRERLREQVKQLLGYSGNSASTEKLDG